MAARPIADLAADPPPDPAAGAPPLRERLRRRLDAALREALPWFPDRAGNRTLLVGFSGGVDSTALLRLLAAGRRAGGRAAPGPRLVAAHLDHRLRPDSGDQADFAGIEAAALGIELVSAAHDVGARARRESRSLEEAGRLERLDFFAEVAHEEDAAAVLLGHTQTDQAETVLLQLARGAGSRGLGGMPPVREDPRGLRIVRPLLGVSRAELARLVEEEGWPVWPDPTNEQEVFARNRVRRRVLPCLAAAVNPQAEAALARAAALLRDDEAWLGELAARRFTEMAEITEITSGGDAGPAEVRVPAAELAASPPALGRRLVREGLRAARGHLRRIEMVHVEAVLRLACTGRGGSSLDLPGAVVRLDRGTLLLRPSGTAEPAAPSANARRNL